VTDRPFEVVVVNNASDDRTADVITEWCRRDERFRGVNEARVGLSLAKNTGVRTARGRILHFTDDDVLIDPNWVDSHLSLLMNKQDLAISGGPILPISSDLSPWPGWLSEASLVDLPMLDHGQPARPLVGRWEQLWGANMAVPLAVFERIGPWNEDLGRKGDERGTWEDLEFEERVRKVGGQVWFCPGAVVRHRIMPERARPRPMLRAAFRRGMNDYVKHVWASVEPGGAAISKLERMVALVALSGHIWRWFVLSLLLRFFRDPRTFDAARGAAWSAGSRMMELTMRRTPGGSMPVEPQFLFHEGRVTARVMQVCFLARRVALRLAPPA